MTKETFFEERVRENLATQTDQTAGGEPGLTGPHATLPQQKGKGNRAKWPLQKFLFVYK